MNILNLDNNIEINDNNKNEYNIDKDTIELFLKQGINLFDLNSPFYNDICFRYISPKNKDVPLGGRKSLFFPNTTLCDEDCVFDNVNTSSLQIKCICPIINKLNIKFIDENF